MIERINNKPDSYFESIVQEMLVTWFDKNNVKMHCQFAWLGNLEVDFVVEKYKIIIETQGTQHHLWMPNFQSLLDHIKLQLNDIDKTTLCEKNGYKIIHVYSPLALRKNFEHRMPYIPLRPLPGLLRTQIHKYTQKTASLAKNQVAFKVRHKGLEPINRASAQWRKQNKYFYKSELEKAETPFPVVS